MLFVLGGPGSGKGTYLAPYVVNAPSWSKNMDSSTSPPETCFANKSKQARSWARRSMLSFGKGNWCPANSWFGWYRKQSKEITTPEDIFWMGFHGDRRTWMFGSASWPNPSICAQSSTSSATKKNSNEDCCKEARPAAVLTTTKNPSANDSMLSSNTPNLSKHSMKKVENYKDSMLTVKSHQSPMTFRSIWTEWASSPLPDYHLLVIIADHAL